MIPVKFPEANVVYAGEQKEYAPLPAYRQPDDPSGAVTVCFNLDADEIAVLLRTGKLWLTMLTFNGPLQPVGLTTISPFPERECEHVVKPPPISNN